jgi:hypothetical protein
MFGTTIKCPVKVRKYSFQLQSGKSQYLGLAPCGSTYCQKANPKILPLGIDPLARYYKCDARHYFWVFPAVKYRERLDDSNHEQNET